MAQSNERQKRKHYAKMVEDEIFTINVELDNLSIRLKEIKFDELKRINAIKLKELRQEIQRLKYLSSTANQTLGTISKPDRFGICSIYTVEETGREILAP